MLVLFSAAADVLGEDSSATRFERQVRPLLVKYCGECHDKEEPENGLTLTTVAGIARGGDSGAVLVPGEPDASQLIQAVRYTSKLKMPPDRRLAPEQIGLLEKWVREGAVVPKGSIAPRLSRSEDGPLFTEDDRNYWAFQPILPLELPAVGDTDQVRTAVDQFVLQKLEQHGLSLSPAADRRSLVRRVVFDLIGLPPTPDEVESFVHDARPDAFERLVDRLLASPQYGERWGRHWLDIARYADTNGGGFDYVYPNAWQYRDYVVRAFNSDKPYHEFVTEQLAGDLLKHSDDPDIHTERLRATGFLTLAPKGLGMQDKQQMVLDVVDDQIDVLGRSLMGLTLACARCHDHKFDPIPTEDYYSLAGIFRSTASLQDTDKNPSYWPERPLELPAVTQARKDNLSRKQANDKSIADLKSHANAAVLAAARKRLSEYLFAGARAHHYRVRASAIAHWTFDEIDGSQVLATAGPAGTLTNADSSAGLAPVVRAGRLGKAVRFAGRKEVVAIDPAKLAFVDLGTTTDFSISFWLRTMPGYTPRTADTVLAVNYPSAMWFIALRPGSYNGIYLRHYNGRSSVDIKPSSSRLALLTDAAWHHIVFTSDRDGNGGVFLDGQKAGSIAIAAASRTATYTAAKTFHIGAATNGFRGDLDDVALWNRVLSAAEVHNLYDGARNRNLNAAQVDGSRERDAIATENTTPAAGGAGLVPSLVQSFAGLLLSADGDAGSPLFELSTQPPASVDEVKAQLAKIGTQLDALLADDKAGPFKPADDFEQFYTAGDKNRLAQLRAEAHRIEVARVPPPALAMVAFDASEISDLAVHIAGDRKQLGDVVPRRFPRIIAGETQSAISSKQSGRLELARWLTNAGHPLTARVIANRVWQWHFGVGLVATPDNFGRLGEAPSHPRLLDWLAAQLIADDWSLKSLHRQIVLSATYRQRSRASDALAKEASRAGDSGNRLLWRMNRRRVEAEVLRDSLLAVSGQLDLHIGGTVNNWKPKMLSVDDANAETANYDTRRRSLYLPVVRDSVYEMMQLFDFGDPNSVTARRETTTVAPQALFLMNSPFVIEQAQHLASRVMAQEKGEVGDRVRLAYRLTIAREPTETELGRAVDFVSRDQCDLQWRLLCQSLLCLNEFAYID